MTIVIKDFISLEIFYYHLFIPLSMVHSCSFKKDKVIDRDR